MTPIEWITNNPWSASTAAVAMLLAVIWAISRLIKKRETKSEFRLRSQEQQQQFQPVSTAYNPKQYRRKKS
ncbi:hypothetical protein ACTJKQ_16940 [Acidovorax sp. 22279]|uniref:hypothetical protein n=1 Tax=Acidovorax sp. 22279 TaxID=3453900 RepID=UPI003F82F3C8